MPVTPDAAESLSGGSGVTRVDLVERILRDRLDVNPVTFRGLSALDGAGVTDELTVKPGALEMFEEGDWFDSVEDGTFEALQVEEVINDTTVKLRRAIRGTTIAAHSIDAVYSQRPRVLSHTVSINIDEAIEGMWPDVYDVRHVAWSVPDPVDHWWILPSDAEGVSELYQRTAGSITTLREIKEWGGPWFLDTGFLTGSNKKAVEAIGVAGNAPDDKLHAIYLAKSTLSNLTTFQQTLLTYEVAALVMASEFAGESKPERRSGLEGAPDAGRSFQFFAVQAEAARKRESKRLAEFLPRKNRRQYRGLRHYGERTGAPLHPVRD